MTHIVVLNQGGNRKTFCGDCADNEPLVQDELKRHEEEGLEVSDREEDALGEECYVCHRQISHLRVEPRKYRVKAAFTFEIDVDLEAVSATQAQFSVLEALAEDPPEKICDRLEKEVESRIEQAIEADIRKCVYGLRSVQVFPPDLDKYVVLAAEK